MERDEDSVEVDYSHVGEERAVMVSQTGIVALCVTPGCESREAMLFLPGVRGDLPEFGWLKNAAQKLMDKGWLIESNGETARCPTCVVDGLTI